MRFPEADAIHGETFPNSRNLLQGALLAKRLLRLATKSVEPCLLAAGLVWGEYVVLSALVGSPSGCVSPSRLSVLTSESLSSITRFTNSLHRKGFVARHASEVDRRGLVVVVTACGRGAFAEVSLELEGLLACSGASLASSDVELLELLLTTTLKGQAASSGRL